MKLNSGLPFSLIRSGLPYNYSKLDTSIETEVAIIGGGISGALNAHALTQAGIQCLVIDKRTIGLGSTAACTSLVQYEVDVSLTDLAKIHGEDSAARAYQRCNEAVLDLIGLCKKLHINDFAPTDSLLFAASKKDELRLQNECSMRQKHGLDVQFLNAQQIADKFSFQAPGAILSSNAAYADAYQLTHAIFQQVQGQGCRVFDRTCMKNISSDKNGFRIHIDKRIDIRAKYVIYATGYESAESIKAKIVDLHSTFVTVSENIAQHKSLPFHKTVIWNTANPYLYLRPTADGRIIISGRDERFANPTKRDKLIRSKTKSLISDFNKLFPSIEFVPEFSWAGTFGKTKDGLPVIGNYRKKKREYFALGFSGNGIVFSRIAADIIRDSILGISNPDAKIFGFERF